MQPIKYKELNSEITIGLFPGNGHSTSMTVKCLTLTVVSEILPHAWGFKRTNWKD